MQIPSSTVNYEVQVQYAGGPPGTPDADHDGQAAPSAGSASGPSGPAPSPAASPGDQFDSTTLGGLLALQQQPPQTGPAAPDGAGGSHPHHHGHHHGHHHPAGGPGGVQGAGVLGAGIQGADVQAAASGVADAASESQQA